MSDRSRFNDVGFSDGFSFASSICFSFFSRDGSSFFKAGFVAAAGAGGGRTPFLRFNRISVPVGIAKVIAQTYLDILILYHSP